MSLPMSLLSAPLKVEDYCAEFTNDLSVLPFDLITGLEPPLDIDPHHRPSVSSVGTISPVSPTFPQSPQDDSDDSWNLIPYNVPWGNNYHNYEYGTLPGPEGACIFLRSPTPVKNQRTSQACKKCRERKAKCSGTRPSCERCLARGHTCVYVDDSKRVRRSTSSISLCHRSNHSQPIPVTRSGSSQFAMTESPEDDARSSSPYSPTMDVLPLEPNSKAEFTVGFGHENSYDCEFSPSPASTSSQSTPLIDYQQGMFDQCFISGEFGYDRPTNFQTYCAPRPIHYSQFDPAMGVTMGCSFENTHQAYTLGGNGGHLTSAEALSHPFNEELLVRPQFVPY